MATLTVNPTTNREGHILNGVSVDTSSDHVDAGKSRWSGTVYEWRGYFGFDTSSLGSGATVTSATLTIYAWRSGQVGTFYFYAGANKFSTPLSTGDWNDYASMTFMASQSTSSLSTSKSSPTKLDLTVPASAVSTTGNTDICYLYPGTPSADGEYYFLSAHSVDSSSTGYWPVLTVEYTTGGGAARRRVFHATVR